mmetsp:Transcript_30399/g.97029  ORF Transcript_30399/g.97029 Transcript_30399/m.97029 type:complete len:278 (+) Transcript_30399:1394-2227(+)
MTSAPLSIEVWLHAGVRATAVPLACMLLQSPAATSTSSASEKSHDIAEAGLASTGLRSNSAFATPLAATSNVTSSVVPLLRGMVTSLPPLELPEPPPGARSERRSTAAPPIRPRQAASTAERASPLSTHKAAEPLADTSELMAPRATAAWTTVSVGDRWRQTREPLGSRSRARAVLTLAPVLRNALSLFARPSTEATAWRGAGDTTIASACPAPSNGAAPSLSSWSAALSCSGGCAIRSMTGPCWAGPCWRPDSSQSSAALASFRSSCSCWATSSSS